MSTQHKRGRKFKVAALPAAILASLAWTSAAAAPPPLLTTSFCGPLDYDNAYVPPGPPPNNGLFTDIRRGAQINEALPFGTCRLDLTGSVGSAGDIWLTVVDGVEGAPSFSCVNVAADILIKRFDNRKAVGVVTNYSPGSQTGLFFGVYDNGNTDALTISQFNAATGQLVIPPVATLPLGSKIKENNWYRLLAVSCISGPSFALGSGATVYDLVTPGPDVGNLPIGGLPLGSIPPSGEVGIAGYAKSSFVDSSVRNFCVGVPGSCD